MKQLDPIREAAIKATTDAARALLEALLDNAPAELRDRVSAALENAQFSISVETQISTSVKTLVWLHERERDARLLFVATTRPRMDA